MESEQLIRANMERTRESLTDKLEALENKLVGSVEEATSAVRETVCTVKESMHESVESVKDAVDVQAHVERRPWLMFGGAVLGGYVLASFLSREKQSARSEFTLTPPRRMAADSNDYGQTPKQESPSMTASLLQTLEPEIRHLKGLALGVTLGTVREMVAKEIPPHLADQLRAIIDGVTKKVGGEPIAPSDLPFAESATCATESTCSPFHAP